MKEHDPVGVKIPKIQLKWEKREGGLFAEEIVLELGMLGKYTLGGPFTVADGEPMTLEEKADVEEEVQMAFSRLLCRLAACSVVELDRGPSPLLGWYQHFREKLKGDATIFHAMPESYQKLWCSLLKFHCSLLNEDVDPHLCYGDICSGDPHCPRRIEFENRIQRSEG